MKLPPIAMIPHKSRAFRAILDLVDMNELSVETMPSGAIDQLGHSLIRIIHTFMQADNDAEIFMTEWDVKDGFWRLDCQEGEEWILCNVLPQKKG